MAFVKRSERFASEPPKSSSRLKLPFIRLILLTLKVFSLCPLTYDGIHFYPQRRPYGSVFYAAFITTSIIAITAALFLSSNTEGLGHEHKGLFEVVASASSVFKISANCLTVVVVIRDRYLLHRCITILERLWQMLVGSC